MTSISEGDNALKSIVKDIVNLANGTRAKLRYKPVKLGLFHPQQDVIPTTTATLPPVASPELPPAPGTTDSAAAKPETSATEAERTKLKSRGDRSLQLPPFRISETLAAFVVRAIVLNPDNQFDITKQLSKEDVDRLVRMSVEKIVYLDDQIYETIKMQVYFDTNFPVQLEFLKAEKQNRVQSTANLLRDIHDNKSRNVMAVEALYRKIVSYILLLGNNGSATDITVVREASAALESVFPPSEIPAFVSLTKNEKEEQLNGLVQLVAGIRLFNRQLEKGGAGIEDVPAFCNTELLGNVTAVNQLRHLSEEAIVKYTSAIDLLEQEDSLPNLNGKERSSTIETLKEGLAFRRQLLLYLTALLEQHNATREHLKSLDEKYEAAIRELKHTCRAKSAVPVDMVYPQFISLATIWTSYQDTLFILALRRGMIETLEYFSLENQRIASVDASIEQAVQTAIAEECLQVRHLEPEEMSDKEIIKQATKLMTDIGLINNKIEVLHPGNATTATAGALPTFTTPTGAVARKLNANGQLYWRLVIEYAGFCPYNLVTRGLLVPGNWNHGLLRYKDKLYAFDSVQDAKAWALEPEKYMDKIVNGVAKTHPDLVQLLHLYQYIPIVDSVENAKNKARHRLLATALKLNQPQTADCGVQTDTHILYNGFSHIDPSYHWNEWDLRRRAIMLVNLRKKATHSSQTFVSHFRKDVGSQCWKHGREHGTQTRRDAATTMPRRLNYIEGLRGGATGKPSKAKIVDLTFEI